MVEHTVLTANCEDLKCSRKKRTETMFQETVTNFTIARAPRDGEFLHHVFQEGLSETLPIPCRFPIECKCGKKCKNPKECNKGFRECKKMIKRIKTTRILDPKNGIIVSLPRIESGKQHQWVSNQSKLTSNYNLIIDLILQKRNNKRVLVGPDLLMKNANLDTVQFALRAAVQQIGNEQGGHYIAHLVNDGMVITVDDKCSKGSYISEGSMDDIELSQLFFYMKVEEDDDDDDLLYFD